MFIFVLLFSLSFIVAFNYFWTRNKHQFLSHHWKGWWTFVSWDCEVARLVRICLEQWCQVLELKFPTKFWNFPQKRKIHWTPQKFLLPENFLILEKNFRLPGEFPVVLCSFILPQPVPSSSVAGHECPLEYLGCCLSLDGWVMLWGEVLWKKRQNKKLCSLPVHIIIKTYLRNITL